MKSGIRFAAFAAATFALGMVAATHAQTTVSFQEGTDGYTGTLDVFIGLDEADIPGGGDGNDLGADMAESWLDGKYFDPGGDDQELQLLLRFDNVFGAGAGQVPLGTVITNATLTLTTGESSNNASSSGPYGVARLLVPFDTSTTWNNFTPLGNGTSLGGATYDGGHNERPLGNGYLNLVRSEGTPNFATTNVTQIVRNWSDGAANEGFVIRAGTTDGWQVFTTGVPTASLRPMLEITFDDAPQPTTTTTTLQQGLDGYFGTTMAWLQEADFTTDGELLDQEFLDGPNLAGTSSDDQALIKFDNIFASIPNDATILEANVIIDTGGAAYSNNVDTPGDFGVHQMLVDWDVTTLYSDFNGDGPTEADGEIGPVSDVTGGMIADARSRLDVTAAVQAWHHGDPNYGLNIQSQGTSNGWAIHFLGSFTPPQLEIVWTEDIVVEFEADFDGDGDVDGDDFLRWQSGFPTASSASKMDGDYDNDGDVDGDDFLGWQAEFPSPGGGAASGAVPEPATFALGLLIACLATMRRRPT